MTITNCRRRRRSRRRRRGRGIENRRRWWSCHFNWEKQRFRRKWRRKSRGKGDPSLSCIYWIRGFKGRRKWIQSGIKWMFHYIHTDIDWYINTIILIYCMPTVSQKGTDWIWPHSGRGSKMLLWLVGIPFTCTITFTYLCEISIVAHSVIRVDGRGLL